MRISVIMPVQLDYYNFGWFKPATDPERKFLRAVNSFIGQTFKDAELIIVSDGCERVGEIYENLYADVENIRYKYIEKQEMFSGKVRQAGLDIATGDIICYLDHDDVLGKDHLAMINERFDTNKYVWVYYNDYLVKSADHTVIEVRDVKPVQNFIGTSSIAHRRDANVVWGDEYGHDMDMIKKYLRPHPYTKIDPPQYYVCHCSGLNMDF